MERRVPKLRRTCVARRAAPESREVRGVARAGAPARQATQPPRELPRVVRRRDASHDGGRGGGGAADERNRAGQSRPAAAGDRRAVAVGGRRPERVFIDRPRRRRDLRDARRRAARLAAATPLRPTQVKGNQIAGGKGTEQLEHYAGVRMRLEFMGIANIHAVRKAHDDLCDAIAGRGDAAAPHAGGGWFALLQRLLAATVHVVDAVARHGVSVLVHCSDGWDRTPQLTAGAMLLMDPFYRTIRGFAVLSPRGSFFDESRRRRDRDVDIPRCRRARDAEVRSRPARAQVLVEKEWCSCGHKFAQRHGFDARGHASSDRSPCFLQWLDAVHQVRRQRPAAFEFNEDFLVCVARAATDGWSGTFLFDCDRLRRGGRASFLFLVVAAAPRPRRGYFERATTEEAHGRTIPAERPAPRRAYRRDAS